jgi:hypothetical protein
MVTAECLTFTQKTCNTDNICHREGCLVWIRMLLMKHV